MEFPTPYGLTDTIAKVEEANTCRLRMVLKDPTVSPAVAIPGSSIATATFTLYDYASSAVINERDHQDISADIDESGVVVIDLDPADNAIIGAGDEPEELHVALVEFTMLSGGRTVRFSQDIGLVVEDIPFPITYPVRKVLETRWAVLSL